MSSEKSSYIVAGLMSGTSLDGLDVAICRFTKNNEWEYKILAAKTFDYSRELKLKLSEAHLLNGENLTQLHSDLGTLHGEWLHDFILLHKFEIDFIASHGHTVFHQPEKGFTLQIASPQHIAAITRIPVVADFRTLDVALGGQGAPLVPIGDLQLFSKYKYCLNLGGIANISIKNSSEEIIAFDICHCNMSLNFIAEKLGHPFDRDGKIAANGKIIPELRDALNQLDYFQKAIPKSLGKELFEQKILPLISSFIPEEYVLTTITHHIADQILSVLNQFGPGDVLVTGGGAYHKLLIELLRDQAASKIVVPEDNIIQFKEALIFAFLGVLRWRNEPNCLASVTGASRNNCGGVIILPTE
jgi:anhydro-N-acetylmuramic acid kinase